MSHIIMIWTRKWGGLWFTPQVTLWKCTHIYESPVNNPTAATLILYIFMEHYVVLYYCGSMLYHSINYIHLISLSWTNTLITEKDFLNISINWVGKVSTHLRLTNIVPRKNSRMSVKILQTKTNKVTQYCCLWYFEDHELISVVFVKILFSH